MMIYKVLPLSFLLLVSCGGGSSSGTDSKPDEADSPDVTTPVESSALPAVLINKEKQYLSSAFIDFDNDGDLDILLGGAYVGDGDESFTDFPKDDLLINDGSGHFVMANDQVLPDRLGGSTWGSLDLEPADINNDGFMDVIISVQSKAFDSEANIQLLLNNQDGSFIDKSENLNLNLTPYTDDGGIGWIPWISAADMNGDGYIDFVTTGDGYLSQVYYNLGNGAFAEEASLAAKIQFGTGPFSTNEIYVYPGDIDQDSDIDIITLGYSKSQQLLNTDKDNRLFSATSLGGPFADGAPLGAFVKSAIDDANPIFVSMYGHAEGTPIRAHQFNASTGILEAVDDHVFKGETISARHPRHFAVADFNGDGIEDLFIADHGDDFFPYPGYQNLLLIQNTAGQLINETATRLPQQWDFTHNVTAGDIDQDGDIDLFVLGGGGDTPASYLLINDGNGLFEIKR